MLPLLLMLLLLLPLMWMLLLLQGMTGSGFCKWMMQLPPP